MSAPTQQCPQAGGLAAVLEADVKDEVAVVSAHEVQEQGATAFHCGDPDR